MRILRSLFLALGFAALIGASAPAQADVTDMPVVKLQSLDKISARTMIFEARVGSTVKFGSLFIKTQACRKSSPLDEPESAAFLQIWEVTAKNPDPHWIFSGWMFASSPALSSMDHPVYDVWVLDCLEHKTGEGPPPAAKAAPDAEKGKEAVTPDDKTKADAKTESGKKAKKKPAKPDNKTSGGTTIMKPGIEPEVAPDPKPSPQ